MAQATPAKATLAKAIQVKEIQVKEIQDNRSQVRTIRVIPDRASQGQNNPGGDR